MADTFGQNSMSIPFRRVSVVGVSEDGDSVKVTDATGWRSTVNGSIRPKGSPAPEVGEVWLIERLDSATWILRAQVAASAKDLGPEINAIISQEIQDRLADEAQAAAERAAQEAALASGIMGGNATVIIDDTAPGPEHQDESTLWIDTRNDLNRPMRWASGQWVVVVDRTAVEAALAAVAAQDAAAAANSLAQSAKDTADAAKDTADAAVLSAENALAAAADKGRVIYGDPLQTPGEEHSLLIGPGNILYYWDGYAWVEASHEALFFLRDELDALVAEVEGNIEDLSEVQSDLTDVLGKVDGKSTIWPLGSSPTLGFDDQGDLRLVVDGGVEYWDGEKWVTADPRVAQVVNDAAEALDLANTKSTTYYKGTEPNAGDIEYPETEFRTNDLWLRTGDNRLHRWDGENWVETKDTAITVAEQALVAVQSDLTGLAGRVDGKSTVHVGESAPAGVFGIEDKGDLWIDTHGGGRVYKVWDGDSWELADDPRVVEVLDTVSTKISTYFTENQPTGTVQEPLTVGDLWLRPLDNRLHRWDGDNWVDAADGRIAQHSVDIVGLQTDLSGLSGRVDDRASIYYQDSAPTGLGAEDRGDIWIDSDADPKKFQSWSGSGWVDITDQTAIDALSRVKSKVTTYYAPEATGPAPDVTVPAGGFTEGDLWVNETRDNSIYRWSGTVWSLLALGKDAISATARDLGGVQAHASASAPLNPLVGDLWIDMSDGNTLKRYEGETLGWVAFQDQGIQAAADLAVAAQGAADSKVRIFTQDTEPGGLLSEDVGDMWIDTDDDNALHIWDGDSWEPRPLGNNAIAPGSLVGSEVIADRTITADLLSATLVLSSRVVAGDPYGAAAEMTSSGLTIYNNSRQQVFYTSGSGDVTMRGSLITGAGTSSAGGFRLDPDGAVTGGAMMRLYGTGRSAEQPGAIYFETLYSTYVGTSRGVVVRSPYESSVFPGELSVGYNAASKTSQIALSADAISIKDDYDGIFYVETRDVTINATRRGNFGGLAGTSWTNPSTAIEGDWIVIGGGTTIGGTWLKTPSIRVNDACYIKSPFGSINLDIEARGSLYMKSGWGSGGSNSNYIRLNDSSNTVYMTGVYLETTTSAANVAVASNYMVRRSTSMRAAKVSIEDHAPDDPYQALALNPVTWIDRGAAERLAQWYEEGADPDSELYSETEALQRQIGLIAEDVEDLGIDGLTTLDGDGNLIGVAYERVAVTLIPALRDLRARVDELERKVHG